MQKMFGGFKHSTSILHGLAVVVAASVGLAGCGSGAVSSSSLPDTGPATLVATLTDVGSAAPRTAIADGNPAKVTATFKTSRGNPIVGAVITFTTDATLGVFNPATGTALTDATGVASVTLSASTASGAGTVTATGQTTISGATAPSTYTSSVSYTATAVVPLPPPGPPTFSVTLTDPTTNATRTSVSPQNPAKVSATFKLSSGAAVAGAVVTFTTTATLGTFIPANGTAVTDSAGVASVLLYPSSTSGSALVTATSQTLLTGAAAPTTVTNTVAYTATAAPAIALSITDPTTGAPRTSISAGNPARVSATLRQTTGAPSVGTVVTFTTDATLGAFSPANGTALTDSNGVATIILNAASLTTTGAAVATASAQIGAGVGSPVTASVGYSVGAGNVTIGPVVIQTPTLSAFGTTGLSVTVSVAGVPTTTPLTVNFTSPCAAAGRAALTSSASTVNGVASATYRDIGCASTDTITATLSGLPISSTGTLSVVAPAVGSIQFVSARPTSIALRGTGGAGRQETSLVSFRVVDVAGNPVGGKTVNFALNTSVGGITLTPASATSDPSTGLVVTNIQAGSVSTPVRVTASTLSGTQTLSTQSDQLTISTGVPAQGGFSLSVSTFNIEGGDIDGISTQITARLADRFSNPVPDGTVVNFTAAGGSIISSCTTVAGACSSTLTSQNFRTANGRIAVLAYAIGEESFTDLNGNGWFDVGELKDLNNISTDLPEAWLDVNENQVRDPLEPFIDFNSNNAYDGADGKFNGVSCDESVAGRSSPGSCGALKSIHVRGQGVVVFSGSVAQITPSVASVSFATCTTGIPFTRPAETTVVFTIRDARDNVMPAGTRVVFTTTNGTIRSADSFTVPNSTACLAANAGCPALAPKINPTGADGVGSFAVTVASNADQTAGPGFICSNGGTGALTATVTTPSGRITTRPINISD